MRDKITRKLTSTTDRGDICDVASAKELEVNMCMYIYNLEY